jgi:hypothetical protein
MNPFHFLKKHQNRCTLLYLHVSMNKGVIQHCSFQSYSSVMRGRSSAGAGTHDGLRSGLMLGGYATAEERHMRICVTCHRRDENTPIF